MTVTMRLLLLGATLALLHVACTQTQDTAVSNATQEPVEVGERRLHPHYISQGHASYESSYGNLQQGSHVQGGHQGSNYQGSGSHQGSLSRPQGSHQQSASQSQGSHQQSISQSQGSHQGSAGHSQGSHLGSTTHQQSISQSQGSHHGSAGHSQSSHLGSASHQHGGYQGSGGQHPGPGSAASSEVRGSPLRLEFGWKRMDFAFPSSAARREAIRTGAYNYSQIIPLDVDVWEKGGRRRVFLTMPSAAGVPASLTTVPDSGSSSSRAPLLEPYPDWSWHRKGDCNGIASVYRIAIDEVDRLWVLDRGDDAQCKPKLLVFDLNTDRLLDRYQLPSSVYRQASNLITPVVDVREHGKNTFVYIADVTEYGIIVYDHQRKACWRVNHRLAAADPAYGTFNIAGSSFTLMDGVFGMALSPLRCDGRRCEDRTLYFHSLASVRENFVKTSVLRNPDNFRDGQNKVSAAFQTFEHTRPSQSAAQAMSSEGVLFSGLLPEMAVTCWNTDTPFAGWNLEVVAQDPETLQFTSGMKVRYGHLWVVSCRYQRFVTNSMDWDEVNYRVQSGRVADLIRGTKCDPKTNIIG